MSLPRRESAAIVLIAPVSTVPEAVASAAAGARLVDVGRDDALIPAIRGRLAGLRICGHGAGADIVRDASLAARTGAGLICPDVRAAADAVQLGIAAERILVRTAPSGIAAAAQSGWTTLVDLAGEEAGPTGEEAGPTGEEAGPAGKQAGPAGQDTLARAAAGAAVCAWLGVAVIRTRHITEIRRSVEMTESILGRRPPAGTLRGLA
jgi:hypothetical protein